jgi:hypothetical protein
MNEIYEIDSNASPPVFRVFDGAGSTVFDSRFAAMRVWATGGPVSVIPSINPWAPGATGYTDVPHNHPSGKSCLTVFKCYGREPLTAQSQWRGPFVRIYDINSHAGDFMTVANTFIRFYNKHFDQRPYFDNTSTFYYAMFDVTTDG